MQETRESLVRMYQFWAEAQPEIAACIGRAILSYDRAQRMIAATEAGKPLAEGHENVLDKQRARMT